MSKFEKSYKILGVLCLILLIASCSKSIYIYHDEYGTLKFTIYKTNYKYEEETKSGKFGIWGTYEIEDSLIIFVLKDKKKIPYNYTSNNVERLKERNKDQPQELFLVDQETNEPILFATIMLKDDLDQINKRLESDIEGVAIIEEAEDTKYVEIPYIRYAKLKFEFEKYATHHLKLKFEKLKPGGRMSDGCLIYSIDVLLEYKVDNPLNINKLMRNGIIYVKQDNLP